MRRECSARGTAIEPLSRKAHASKNSATRLSGPGPHVQLDHAGKDITPFNHPAPRSARTSVDQGTPQGTTSSKKTVARRQWGLASCAPRRHGSMDMLGYSVFKAAITLQSQGWCSGSRGPCVARVGVIDRSIVRSPCARRSDRPKHPRASLRASVSSDRGRPSRLIRRPSATRIGQTWVARLARNDLLPGMRIRSLVYRACSSGRRS